MNPQIIRETHKLIAPWINRTPLVRSPYFSQLVNRDVWLKLETLQPTGSFKVRPAFSGILANLAEARKRGVIASSSGNFAQAVAYAAKQLDIRATIVMTSNSAAHKIEATRALGAEVILSAPDFNSRWQKTNEVQQATNKLLLHPYDSLETIYGDATIAIEIEEQIKSDIGARDDTKNALYLFSPASGGGLLAGLAATMKKLMPEVKVFGAQPELNGAMASSLKAGLPTQCSPRGTTIADALVASKPGALAFDHIQKNIDDFFLITEEELKATTLAMINQQKLVAEPGGVAGLAAAIKYKETIPANATVVCIISGGNVGPIELFR